MIWISLSRTLKCLCIAHLHRGYHTKMVYVEPSSRLSPHPPHASRPPIHSQTVHDAGLGCQCLIMLSQFPWSASVCSAHALCRACHNYAVRVCFCPIYKTGVIKCEKLLLWNFAICALF